MSCRSSFGATRTPGLSPAKSLSCLFSEPPGGTRVSAEMVPTTSRRIPSAIATRIIHYTLNRHDYVKLPTHCRLCAIGYFTILPSLNTLCIELDSTTEASAIDIKPNPAKCRAHNGRKKGYGAARRRAQSALGARSGTDRFVDAFLGVFYAGTPRVNTDRQNKSQ
mgnify:CR=1 FL=1|jgi:hypothetical protein